MALRGCRTDTGKCPTLWSLCWSCPGDGTRRENDMHVRENSYRSPTQEECTGFTKAGKVGKGSTDIEVDKWDAGSRQYLENSNSWSSHRTISSLLAWETLGIVWDGLMKIKQGDNLIANYRKEDRGDINRLQIHFLVFVMVFTYLIGLVGRLS